MPLYFITGNKGKLKEVQAIISNVEQVDLDLLEIQEIDSQKIITAKLKEAVKNHQGKFFIEDTSLHLECLNGFPGPLVKWLADRISIKGIFELVNKYDNKTVVARSSIGYYDGISLYFFSGEIKGMIVAPKGENGFGWDHIFQPEGYDKTFAEMTLEEKNKISHRKRALMNFKRFLDKNG